MKQYVYLVPYTFENGNGRVFITRSTPISTPEDIEGIEAIQNERNNFRCAVMGFYLLSCTEVEC